MKLYFNYLWIIGILWLFVTTGSLKAQKQSIYMGIGVASLQGETTDQKIMDEDYGLHYSVKYFTTFENERWVFTADAGFSSINLGRDFSNDQKKVQYQTTSAQTYVGLGLRFYLTRNVEDYNPYRGMVLPFVGINVGGLHTVRNSNLTSFSPATAFKKPVEDPTSGYQFEEGATYELNGQIEGGLVYILNTDWAIEGSCLARPGFSDTWDGITGQGPGKDWFVSGGLGVHFRF